MKRFLRSKLVLTFAAFLMIAAAIVIPLSGKIIGTHAQAPSSTTSHFVVNANQDLPGLDTGIDLIVGSGITITASGQAQFSPDFTNDCNTTEETNPDGQRILLVGTLCPGKIDSGAVLPESPVGTLIANIGSSRWFAVGSSDGFTVATSGRLFLLYNDISGEYGNNSGSYQVTVTVTSAPPPVSISLAKAATPSVTPGGTITYTLTLSNTSPSGTLPLHDIQLADTPPAPAIVSISAPSTPIITPSGAASVNCSASTNHSLSCSVDDFAFGAKVTITFSAKVDPNVTPGGTITNKATAQSSVVSATALVSTSIRKILFVLIGGLTSNLTDTKSGFNTVEGTITSTPAFQDSEFLVYSYKGSTSSGQPQNYSCELSANRHIADYVALLNTQIKNALNGKPNTDVYIIGHSSGGVIAYGYLTSFIEHLGVSLPQGQGDQLKGVFTLDAPLGGIPNNDNYLKQAVTIFDNKCDPLSTRVSTGRGGGHRVQLIPILPLDDFVKIHATSSKTPTPEAPKDPVTDPLGARAGIGLALLSGSNLSNEQIAETAAAQGVSVLTVGNTNDLLFNPSLCTFGIFPDFVGTQYIEDEGHASGAYGRIFSSGGPFPCVSGVFSGGNHGAVLSNGDVQLGIREVLQGQSPTSLKSGVPDQPGPQ